MKLSTVISQARVLLPVALLVIAGCEMPWSSKQKSSGGSRGASSKSGEPLITFGSKIYMTVDDFADKWKMLQESQPGIEALVCSMPETEQLKIYHQFAEGCVGQGLIGEDVSARGLDKTSEYLELSKRAHEAIDDQLRVQVFQNDLMKETTKMVDAMSEAEVRSFYDANREKNRAFQSEPFLKRRGMPGKDDKDKKPNEYAPFEEVRDAVKQVLVQEKFGGVFQAKLDELKKKYDAKVQSSCLNRLVKKSPAAEQPPVAMPEPAAEEAPEMAAKPAAAPMPANKQAA